MLGQSRPEQHPVEEAEIAALLPHLPSIGCDDCTHDIARGSTRPDRTGNPISQTHSIGERVAGGWVEKCGGEPDACCRLQIFFDKLLVSPCQYDRQHTGFLTDDLGDLPPLKTGVAESPRFEPIGRQIATVAIVGILDQNAPFIERQQIDEAVSVMLGNRGVHNDGNVEPMRFGETHLDAEKFLEAEHQMRGLANAACIDDTCCSDLGAAGQHDALGPDVSHCGAQSHRGVELFCNGRVQPLRGY